MNDIDFERAAMLMDVIQKVANISPMNTAISGEAQVELKEIQRLAKENADERAEQIRKEEQVAQQQQLAAQKADREEHDGQTAPLANNPIPPSITPGQPTNLPADRASPTDRDADGKEDTMQGRRPNEPMRKI